VPLSDFQGEITPMPPDWSAVTEQLHWPLVLVEQVAVFHPTAVNAFPILEHSMSTDETDRQSGASGHVKEPVVVVASVYVPSDLAVHVPVTWRDPVTGTVGQPRLDNVMSMSPDKVRHEDVTVQVPTTSPPQDSPLGQLLVAPPLPLLPPVAREPPLPVLPPVAREPPLAVLPPVALEPPLPAPPLELPPLPGAPPLEPELELELEPVQPLVTIVKAKVTEPTSPIIAFRMEPRRKHCEFGRILVTDSSPNLASHRGDGASVSDLILDPT
jgi:hypothetical protein